MGEDNIKNSIKYDIKTSFLIANSFNALIGGLFPLSVGTGMVLYREGCIPPILYTMVAVGVPMAGFAPFGFYAAFKEHKKMLNIYSVLMGLVAAMEALIVAGDMLILDRGDEIIVYNFFILHTGITLAAMALALYLAKLVPSMETFETPKSGLGHCLKYVGYGVLVVLIVGYIIKFVDI